MILNVLILIMLGQFLFGITYFIVKALRSRCVSGIIIYSMSYLSCMYMMIHVVLRMLE